MRPFVIRTHFYLPSGKGKTSPKAATAHLRYMIDPERHQSENEELLMPDHTEAGIHAKYMIERPGSLGGFGPEGQKIPDPNTIAKLFEHHEGPIWRCFISVKEEDVRAMGGGLLTRKGWEDATRRQLPKMAQALGLRSDNIDWIAAVHRKDGHPHIHLLLWEKEHNLTPAQAVQRLVTDPLPTKAQAKAEAAVAKMAAMRQQQIDHAELQSARRTAQTVSAGLSRMAKQADRGVARQAWEIEQDALERGRRTRAL